MSDRNLDEARRTMPTCVASDNGAFANQLVSAEDSDANVVELG
jgi:hypothetical protein